MSKHGTRNFSIVGVGASAGGVEALIELFRDMPVGIGLGFVVVTHLGPGRESSLPGIIASHSALPVEVVRDGRWSGRAASTCWPAPSG